MNLDREITAADLNKVVEAALHCRRADNGMKLNPKSKVVARARVRLEEILELANFGRYVKIAKKDMLFLGFPPAFGSD